MCAKIVSLVWKGGMRERWTEDRLLDDIQSYHSTRSEFRLTEIAFGRDPPSLYPLPTPMYLSPRWPYVRVAPPSRVSAVSLLPCNHLPRIDHLPFGRTHPRFRLLRD